MNDKDRKRFLLAINQARITLPGLPLNDKEKAIRIEVFWENLCKYSIELVESAFQKSIRELKFFPSPKEIIDFIEPPQIIENTYYPEFKQIEYERPSEEGIQHIREILGAIFKKWDIEDEERKIKRQKEFEISKGHLKKQAKLFK